MLTVLLVLCLVALNGALQMARMERDVSAYASGGDANTLRLTLDRSRYDDPDMMLMAARGYGALAVRARQTPDRVQSMAAAQHYVTAALQARPDSGEALVLSASIASLDDNGRAVESYAASFRAAPYLRAESLWRMKFGTMHWHELDHATQTAMLREAAWVAEITPKDRMTVIAILGDTPAAVRFATDGALHLD
ncbi:hypothetical protein C8J40_11331 [Sphingomonas sp. PP-CC-3A-396]|nr:hypothetical protein C8J40_11331 [Sphingomonas sp. PP-CC-3A-396]